MYWTLVLPLRFTLDFKILLRKVQNLMTIEWYVVGKNWIPNICNIRSKEYKVIAKIFRKFKKKLFPF